MILTVALRFGGHLSAMLEGGSDESLLLAVFGLTLLVGGLAQRLEVSAAIRAFLVGLALSGPVQHRAGVLIGPLRDLFAASSSSPSRSRSIRATWSARSAPPRSSPPPVSPASSPPDGSPPVGPASPAGAGNGRGSRWRRGASSRS